MRIFIWLFLFSSTVVLATQSPRVEAITQQWKSYFVDEDAFETSHMDLSTTYDSIAIENDLFMSDGMEIDNMERYDMSSSIPDKYKQGWELSSQATHESETDDKPSVQDAEGLFIMRSLETRRENMRRELQDIKRRMEGVIEQGYVGEGALPFTSTLCASDQAPATSPRKVVVSVEI
jgi:hypothetical protein